MLTFASSTGKPRVHLYNKKRAGIHHTHLRFTTNLHVLRENLRLKRKSLLNMVIGQAAKRQLSYDLPFFALSRW